MITYQDLIDDLASGCKPKEKFRVGVEHEQFSYNLKTAKPLPYDSKDSESPSVLKLLEAFTQKYNWEKIFERDYLIALKDSQSNYITLEPGGAVEYSGAPMNNVREVQIAMDKFYAQLDTVAKELGIGFLPKGFHPTWKMDEISQMPKQRAQIMDSYMKRLGGKGCELMYSACTAQINLDHSSEAEMVQNLRLSLALQPVVIALMANSSHVEGKDTGYSSYRSDLWNNTDLDRCGILPFAFEEGMGFARYVDYALDVPMYFFCREGELMDVTGLSFRDFMEGKLPGYEGHYPTMNDWHDHLSTLFPEVRLKHYLELRGADSNTPEMVYAMTAFWTGVLYDQEKRAQAWDFVKNWTVDDYQKIRETVPKLGLKTPTPDGRYLSDLARDVLSLLDNEYLVPYKEILQNT